MLETSLILLTRYMLVSMVFVKQENAIWQAVSANRTDGVKASRLFEKKV